MRVLVVVLLLILLLPGYSGASVPAELSIVTTSGYGLIIDNNVAGARERAIEDGLRKAITKVLGERVGKEVFSRNFPLFVERFLLSPEEFLESYRITGEKEGEGIYRVDVEATLSIRLIEKRISDLDMLFGEGIKALLMVSEKDLTRLPVYWWSGLENDMGRMEKVLKGALLETGLIVVDPFLGPFDEIPPDLRVPYLSRDEIERFGKLFDADLVVYGELAVDESDFPFSLFNKRGKVELRLRVFSVAEGRELLSYRSTIALSDLGGFSLENSPQIYDRLTWTLPRDLLLPLIKKLKKEERRVIRITFMDVTSYREYQSIKRWFETMEEVSRVELKSFSKGSFSLLVETKIKPTSLLEMLEEADWEGFVLKPYKVFPSDVGLKIIPQGQGR